MANAYGKPDRDILYTCGPIARSVADAAAMLDAMAGLDGGRPHWAPAPRGSYRALLAERPRPMRIRFTTRSPLGETHPDIATAVERAAQRFGELGHHVEEGRFPEATVDEFLPLWQHLVSDFPLAMWSRAQPITRWLAEPGQRLRAADMLALARRLAARFLADLGDAEVWLTPTVALPPPELGAYARRPPAEAFADAARLGAFTAGFNLTGQPAASVPLGLTREGLPMGLQIVGRAFAEDDVLALSRQIEEADPWRGRRAPMVGDAVG